MNYLVDGALIIDYGPNCDCSVAHVFTIQGTGNSDKNIFTLHSFIRLNSVIMVRNSSRDLWMNST